MDTSYAPVTAYVIQHCSQCKDVAIRVPIGCTMHEPVCKWCAEGRCYPSTPVPGLPDPENPWPWLDEEERERRLRLPFWRARFEAGAKKHPGYAKWLRKPELESA